MIGTTARNIRLGIVVLLGLFFLIVGLYFIGDKQGMFRSTFDVTAYFDNVNGLMKGHNVRFSGVNVGTVSEIEVLEDSKVKVTMSIDVDYQNKIKKNSIAKIGTDGLMGNKLVDISSVDEMAPALEEGDILTTLQPIETDAVLRQLTATNEDVNKVAENLRIFTDKMNAPNSTWRILTDTSVNINLKKSMNNIKTTTSYSAKITQQLSGIVNDIRSGEGTLGELLYDTTLQRNITSAISNIQIASDSLLYITGELSSFTQKAAGEEGALNTVISDTAFNRNLKESMENINKTSKGLEETIEALKSSFIIKRLIIKKEKEQEKKSDERSNANE
ncbi:MAG: MlaD family protein [Crocinitomicaceae bacterium]